MVNHKIIFFEKSHGFYIQKDDQKKKKKTKDVGSKA
jgi:hypothetical protein